MKSLIIHLSGLVKSRDLAISLSAITVAAMSPIAIAAGATWSLESKTSYARFFRGSAAKPYSSNIGVARLTGQVMLDTNDVDKSFLDLSIYPAGEDWGGPSAHTATCRPATSLTRPIILC
jgi:polyisoprenoid-binding protein YceI